MKVTLSKVKEKDIISTTNLEMEWEDICYMKNNIRNERIVNGFFTDAFDCTFGDAVINNKYDLFIFIEEDQIFNLKNIEDSPYLERL